MKIYGIDFAAAPSQRKLITWAECIFKDGVLRVEEMNGWSSFDGFEKFLRSDGPWIAGMDFPFGQPRKLVEDLGWPFSWESYVCIVSGIEKDGFEKTLTDYKSSRPGGDKHHLRETDRRAKSQSPMMLYGTPVGKMFFQGAPRLLKSSASILPCRPLDKTGTVIVEAYPKLVVQSVLGEYVPYKGDSRKKQTKEQRKKEREKRKKVRKNIVLQLAAERIKEAYGLTVKLQEAQKKSCMEDPSGDRLDAVLCAVQAAWAYTKRNEDYGIPKGHELEGWIVDPFLLRETILNSR